MNLALAPLEPRRKSVDGIKVKALEYSVGLGQSRHCSVSLLAYAFTMPPPSLFQAISRTFKTASACRQSPPSLETFIKSYASYDRNVRVNRSTVVVLVRAVMDKGIVALVIAGIVTWISIVVS